MSKIIKILMLVAAFVILGVSVRSVSATDNPKPKKMVICHKPGTPAQKTKVIKTSAWKGHKKHGDYRGKCKVRPTPTPIPSPTPTPEPEYCKDESALNYKEEGECEYPEPTPTPTTPYVPEPQPPNPPGAPVCDNLEPVVVPVNPHVVRNGSEATVNAHILEGDRVNIYFRENSEEGWTHADRDIWVDDYLSHVVRDLDPALGYTFGIQSGNGCAGGETVLAVIVDPPAYGEVFTLSYYEWLH